MVVRTRPWNEWLWFLALSRAPPAPAPNSPSPTAVSLIAPVVAVVVAVTQQCPGDAGSTATKEALTPSTERWKEGGRKTMSE